MTFRKAVARTPLLAKHYKKGIRALGRYSSLIKCKNPRLLTGSVDIDTALKPTQPNAKRWDYGIGLRRGSSEVVVWVEVHPASSDHIDEVLGKLKWLQNFLRNDAPALGELPQHSYYWLSPGSHTAITADSPQARRLAQAGLIGPRRVLHLP